MSLNIDPADISTRWVDNVLAIGNAGGFVEPLESSGLMMVCLQIQAFVELFQQTGPTPTVKDLFNKLSAAAWDEIRDFLTLHFWVNTRLDTPYWQHCRHDADISRLSSLLEFYEENGPADYGPYHTGNTGSATASTASWSCSWQTAFLIAADKSRPTPSGSRSIAAEHSSRPRLKAALTSPRH